MQILSKLENEQLTTNQQTLFRSYQSFNKITDKKVADYFCKLDPSKVCHLEKMIRKMQENASSKEILGRPEEISQFIENSQLKNITIAFDQKLLVSAETQQIPIKIEYSAQNTKFVLQISNPLGDRQANTKKNQEPLTLEDMNNKPGFFIGRLVRYKFGSKQAKDGPMAFFYLGFLDINGDIVRVNLAGRIAIKQSRELKKRKVYYIKGLQMFQGEKIKGNPQIRLKQKDYRIQQILNEVIKSQYKHNYFRWQHESEWIESQMVDVIGIVEDIEEKTSYKNANTFQQQRDVVRLIIRNAFKTVRINFWADQITILNNLNLQKKQAIVIEDIKKKKSIFLDYITQLIVQVVCLHFQNHPLCPCKNPIWQAKTFSQTKNWAYKKVGREVFQLGIELFLMGEYNKSESKLLKLSKNSSIKYQSPFTIRPV